MLTAAAVPYRPVCVRSWRGTDRPPLRGSRPPSPPREPGRSPEASPRFDSASYLPPPSLSTAELKAKVNPQRNKQSCADWTATGTLPANAFQNKCEAEL